MTGPNEPDASSRDGHAGVLAASHAVRRAAIDLARCTGVSTIRRPAFPGSQILTSGLRPLDGARAARRIELAARHETLEYIRQAREAGATWLEIGHALGIDTSADTGQSELTVAQAAYSYAAGSPDKDAARRNGRSFGWICWTCQQVISDTGPGNGPTDEERGHSASCKRLAATIASWHAQQQLDSDLTGGPVQDPSHQWARGQLRDRIVRTGPGLTPEAQASDTEPAPGAEPHIDREAEP